MRELYLECQMGAAGDMLMSALFELLDPPLQKSFLDTMNHLGPLGIQVTANSVSKCGITGTQMEVLVEGEEELPDHHHDHNGTTHHHSHAGYSDVLHRISHLDLPQEVRQQMATVYRRIGEAESQVHGMSIEEIHFHEVGTLDALADVAGCCLLVHMLHPDRIGCSPIHVGNGTVHCAHGILPVPAPATALLLQGIPYYSGTIMSELCTPTGAALLAEFVQEFGPHPAYPTQKIGYGMGHKDFEEVNCLRAFLLDVDEPGDSDRIMELQCNLDDMTGEDISFATLELFTAGALDVYTIPIQMKKGRPGVLLSCLCKPEDCEKMARQIFAHTSTRGIRYRDWDRMKLFSTMETKDTAYGSVQIKRSTGYGVDRGKPEYEDLAALARKEHISIQQVRREC